MKCVQKAMGKREIRHRNYRELEQKFRLKGEWTKLSGEEKWGHTGILFVFILLLFFFFKKRAISASLCDENDPIRKKSIIQHRVQQTIWPRGQIWPVNCFIQPMS